MSKRIMEAVDVMTEGALTDDEEVLARRKAVRDQRKAERAAARKKEDEAYIKQAADRYKPAFVKGEEPGDSAAGGWDEEPAPPRREEAPSRARAASEPRAGESREAGSPRKKVLRVGRSITLPSTLWEALDQYMAETSLKTGEMVKSRSEVICRTLLENEGIASIYEELSRGL